MLHLNINLYEDNKDRGWDREKPDNTAHTVEGYMRFNYGIILAGLALMSFFLLKYFRTKGSWMEASENGIQTSWGTSLEFDKISKINKKRWEAKGIAKVAYTDEDGKQRTMVFDDFKYERAPMAWDCNVYWRTSALKYMYVLRPTRRPHWGALSGEAGGDHDTYTPFVSGCLLKRRIKR